MSDWNKNFIQTKLVTQRRLSSRYLRIWSEGKVDWKFLNKKDHSENMKHKYICELHFEENIMNQNESASDKSMQRIQCQHCFQMELKINHFFLIS